MTSVPGLTVVLPVRNAGAYLSEALESLWQQTFRDFVVLAIDDGSTDGSLAVLERQRDPRLRIVRRAHQGLVRTLNEALTLAQTPYIARMDADDRSLPGRLERQMAALASDPGLVLIGTPAQIIDARGRTVGALHTLSSDAGLRRMLAVANAFVHGSVLFRREAAIAAGGYRSEALLVEDYDLWWRLAGHGRLANLPQPGYQWRAHPQGESRLRRAKQREASERLADDIWRGWFAQAGPAPRSAWPEIWNADVAPPLAASLHLAFSRAYRKRGLRGAALAHAWAALGAQPASIAGWAYLHAALLPRRTFLALEQWSRERLERTRGW